MIKRNNSYKSFKIFMSGEKFTPQSIAHELGITVANAQRIINHSLHHKIIDYIGKVGQTNYYRIVK